ncbi:hypothetical protein ACFQV2_07215 [Actinokineospora soli]|uniref:Uncharacterized protein n=1 Tax=Actinokineospora soli TaxID=1048753 RepID=A0ABW2TKA7_9PSEU
MTRGRSWPDAVLDAALAEAEDGRLGAARTVLAECRAEPEIRAFRVGELAKALLGFGDEIATIAGAGDPDLLLLSGAVFVREAWAIRGTTPARAAPGCSAATSRRRSRRCARRPGCCPRTRCRGPNSSPSPAACASTGPCRTSCGRRSPAGARR